MSTNPALPKVATRGLSSNAIRFGSLILVVITIIALGAVAYFTERAIAIERDSVIHTYQVRSQLDDLQLEIIRAHASEIGYALTAEEGRSFRSGRTDSSQKTTQPTIESL